MEMKLKLRTAAIKSCAYVNVHFLIIGTQEMRLEKDREWQLSAPCQHSHQKYNSTIYSLTLFSPFLHSSEQDEVQSRGLH